MSIALVHKVGATAAGTPSTLALPAMNVTTGNFIIGAATNNGHHLSTVTDTAGNTYTLLAEISGAATPPTIQGFYAKNVTGNAANIITLTYDSTANLIEGVAFEYSGVDKTSPIDAFASGFNNSPSNPQQTGAFTTTYAYEGIFSAISIDNARSTTSANPINATSPYTIELGGGNDLTTTAILWAEDNIVSAIQTGITAGFTGIDRFNIFSQSFKADIVLLTSWYCPDRNLAIFQRAKPKLPLAAYQQLVAPTPANFTPGRRDATITSISSK